MKVTCETNKNNKSYLCQDEVKNVYLCNEIEDSCTLVYCPNTSEIGAIYNKEQLGLTPFYGKITLES